MMSPALPARTVFVAAALALAAAGCSTGGGLSSGLTARMDEGGARLNTSEAIGIINPTARPSASVPWSKIRR